MRILYIFQLILALCLICGFSSYIADENYQGKNDKYVIDLGSSDPDKTYHVIAVRGDIFIEDDFKRKIKPGDKLSGNMKIVAKTKDVDMTVYNTKDNVGRRSLSPGKFKEYNNSRFTVFIDFLRAYFIPSPKNPATRDGILNNKSKIDIFNHFRATARRDIHLKPYLVLGTSKIYISPEVYPLNKGSFFFIRYIYNGEEINKKIPSQGNYIFINRDKLYRIDDKPISGEGVEAIMEVYYYNSRKNKSILIANFQPVFPDEKKLIKEVSALISALKEAKKDSYVLDEVLSFLSEYYGTPYKDNVKVWLEEKFGLIIQ